MHLHSTLEIQCHRGTLRVEATHCNLFTAPLNARSRTVARPLRPRRAHPRGTERTGHRATRASSSSSPRARAGSAAAPPPPCNLPFPPPRRRFRSEKRTSHPPPRAPLRTPPLRSLWCAKTRHRTARRHIDRRVSQQRRIQGSSTGCDAEARGAPRGRRARERRQSNANQNCAPRRRLAPCGRRRTYSSNVQTQKNGEQTKK